MDNLLSRQDLHPYHFLEISKLAVEKNLIPHDTLEKKFMSFLQRFKVEKAGDAFYFEAISKLALEKGFLLQKDLKSFFINALKLKNIPEMYFNIISELAKNYKILTQDEVNDIFRASTSSA